MSGDPYKTIMPGARGIPAALLNGARDVVLAHKRQSLPFGASAQRASFRGRGGTHILVKNVSGAAVSAYESLNIDGPVFETPAGGDFAKSMLAHGVVMKGDVLDANDEGYWWNIAIAQEPIANGNVGLAVISGVTPAWLDPAVELGQLVGGPGAQLEQNSDGAAEVLWIDAAGGDPRLGVVNMGRTPAYGPFAARITARSGATNATYSAETLGRPHYTVTNIAPISRLISGPGLIYAAADVGDPCEIFFDPQQGAPLLNVFTETVTAEECGSGVAASAWMGF